MRWGGWGDSAPFQRSFFSRDWDRYFFFGMGINPKSYLLGGTRRRSLVFFEAGRWDCFNFPWNYSFGDVRWGVWRKKMGIFFLLFFFLL